MVTDAVPSLKSHTHLLIYPAKPEGMNDKSVKFTAVPIQLAAEKVNSATGFGCTVTGFVTEWIHPLELTMVNVA